MIGLSKLACKPISRRQALHYGFSCLTVSILTSLSCSAKVAGKTSNLGKLGGLLAPDRHGLRLPQGFSSRIIARSGQAVVPGSPYLWHGAPDGGAVLPVDDGWLYISNSELPNGAGGVGVIRFDHEANMLTAYSICSGTSRNCAGGLTPWQTWLSCEETDTGIVWECDPYGQRDAIPRPALGVFRHEAAAVDSLQQHVYLSEDHPQGGLYRFEPDVLSREGFADLSRGKLKIAQLKADNQVVWHDVPDPTASTMPTRDQVPAATRFNGGEGLWFHEGLVYLGTKGDNRVWVYNTTSHTLDILYDAADYESPVLTGVDNLTMLPMSNDLIVAEDGGDLGIVALTEDGQVVTIAQLLGHEGSEVTGPAFTVDGTRLYFSSQRGTAGRAQEGITFEVRGPFLS